MNSKPWYRSLTIWLAIFQAVAGAYFSFFQNNPQIELVGGAALVKSAIDVILRFITTQPIE